LRAAITKRRGFRLVLVLVLLGAGSALGAGCGSSPAARAPAAPACEDDMRWGGWDGSPECAKISHAMIPAADLSCSSNADCAIVGRSGCGANSVSRAAAARYANHAPACGHPEAGQCPPLEFVATCRAGCCNVGIADAPAQGSGTGL
jgi:hypothetical protein